MRSVLFWNVTQQIVVKNSKKTLISWPLKMGPIGCPETSVRNCHFMARNIPEKRTSHIGHIKFVVFVSVRPSILLPLLHVTTE